jgi:type IX secretion system PorP/SprF family membrane protein
MIPRFFTLFTILFASISLGAQQLPLFTQYREHIGMLNPAAPSGNYFLYGYTGSASTSFRRQWVGKADAPRTGFIQGSMLLEREGVSPMFGGHIINDQVGRVATTGLYARGAGILSEDPAYSGISVGMSLGIVQYRVDLQGVIARDPDDDLILNADLHRRIYPDVSIGIYTWRQLGNKNDYIFGGVSIPQTLGLDVTYRPSDKTKFYINQARHYYSTFGYIKSLGREGSLVEVNTWVKYVKNAPIHVDANVRYQIGHNFWIGSGFGTSKALHLEAGLLMAEQRVKLGIGYDMNLSDKILAFGQSQEFNASYGFGQSRAW